MEEAVPVERVMWGMERVRSSSWGVVLVVGCEGMIVIVVVRWKWDGSCLLEKF